MFFSGGDDNASADVILYNNGDGADGDTDTYACYLYYSYNNSNSHEDNEKNDTKNYSLYNSNTVQPWKW